MEGNKVDQQINMKINSLAGGSGGSIEVQEGGTPVVASCDTLNFSGGGVSITDAGGGEAKLVISGGGGATGEAFSPLNVGAVGVVSIDLSSFNNIIYLTIAEYDGNIDNVTVYGANAGEIDGDVEVACYRWVGVDDPGNVLMGIAATDPVALCKHGPNVLNFVAEPGQTMEVTAGENIMIGMRLKAGTWETVGLDQSFDNWVYAIESGGGSVDFPDSYPVFEDEGWQSTTHRFACTLWQEAGA